MLNENQKGLLAAITANVIFGINTSISKSLFNGNWMTPIGYTYSRLIFGLVVFWILGLFKEKEKIVPGDLLIIMIGGFLGIAGAQITFFSALQYTTPVTMSLLSALGPIIVLLLSALFLKDPVSLKKAIGVIFGISGAALVVLKNGSSGASSNSALGISLAFASLMCNSTYLIMIRKVAGKYNLLTLMKWMFLVSAIILTPFGITDLPKQRVFTSEVTMAAIFQFVYILVLTNVIGLLLIPFALKRIKATSVSMCANLQLLTASLVATLVGQDYFSWDKLVAMILIISGVFIVTQSKSGKNSIIAANH